MGHKPIKTIPSSMMDGFTMGGKIQVTYRFYDNTTINRDSFTIENLEKLKAMARRKKVNYYADIDRSLFPTLDKYKVDGKNVCIVGSRTGWYEAIALVNGASSVTVLEYNLPPDFTSEITYMYPSDLRPEHKFDIVWSFSSAEHDGLGRYGDPLDPDGDLNHMSMITSMMHEKSLLFLAVPVGVDKVIFNGGRRYAAKRLPLLLRGFETIEIFGPEKNNLFNGVVKQPIFILKLKDESK